MFFLLTRAAKWLASPAEGDVKHTSPNTSSPSRPHVTSDWRPLSPERKFCKRSAHHPANGLIDTRRNKRGGGGSGSDAVQREKWNQRLNYCMIVRSQKTWASFGIKCLIIGFRPCRTHAIPPTNGSVWRNRASWVREGQKISRRQN